MSLGSFVLGTLNGLTVGLLAVGLVLVFKTSRFLNLAHAQMGALSALLVAKLVLDYRWNWAAAFAVAIVAGVLTGVVVERFLVRPLKERGTASVRLMFLSLGVSQLLLALTFIPGLEPAQSESITDYPQPFSSHLQIGLVVLNGMSLLTLILVPVLTVALAVVLKFTRTGRLIRASAGNPDAARLCGVPVPRVYALSWGLAGALAATSAVLQAPSQATFNASAFGPYLLLLTLGAAAFGAFVSLPWSLAGGLVLGILSQLVTADTSDATVGELAVFAAILLVLLVRGPAIGRVFGLIHERSDDIVAAPVLESRPMGERFWLNPKVVPLAALVAAGAIPFFPYFNTTGHRFELTLIGVYALIGVALTMLVGWAGQVSLGHFALVGIAAYLTARWAPHGVSLIGLFVVSGAIGAVVMVVIGSPALRVAGLTLVVTTLGVAAVSQDWLFHQSWMVSGQPEGLPVNPPRFLPGLPAVSSQLGLYFVSVGLVLLAVACGRRLRRSEAGRRIVAVRDNELAATALGVRSQTNKLAALALSGAVVAIAGVLWAVSWGYVSSEEFSANVSIALLAIPVIGGLGSLGGAVAAAVLLYASTFFLGPLVTSVFGSVGQNAGFQLFLAGSSTVGTLLAYPAGLAGVWAEAQARWSRSSQPTVLRAVGDIDLGRVDDTLVGVGLEIKGSLAETPASAVEPAPSSPGEIPLLVSGVHVHFGGIRALEGVNIEVREGEIVGLIGPNGAGKSTLMNAISGIVRTEDGSIRLFGRDVAHLSPVKRVSLGMGRTFQHALLFPGLTVRESLQLGLGRDTKAGLVASMLSAPWITSRERWSQQESRRLAKRFGLTPWYNNLTRDLSTGTRRICDLAVQTASTPRLLMLDEPTAGVSQRDAEAFGPLIRRIQGELNCSILIVEHDMPLLMQTCDRIYAMDSGRILASGTPAEIRADPSVIASYLGTSDAAIERSGPRSGCKESLDPAAISAEANHS